MIVTVRSGDAAAGHDRVSVLLPGRAHEGHRRAPGGHGGGGGRAAGGQAGAGRRRARRLGRVPAARRQRARRGPRARHALPLRRHRRLGDVSSGCLLITFKLFSLYHV